MLDREDIESKKDGVGLPFMFTDCLRIRRTAYQGLFRLDGATKVIRCAAHVLRW